MNNKPTGTREDPIILSAGSFWPITRLHIVEEREDGTLLRAVDDDEYFYAPRDQTFTRAQEKRISELIESTLRRCLTK